MYVVMYLSPAGQQVGCAVLATRDRMRGLLGLLIDDPRPDGP
jgi:hypothetical protein